MWHKSKNIKKNYDPHVTKATPLQSTKEKPLSKAEISSNHEARAQLIDK
jgi:hypothetical protein